MNVILMGLLDLHSETGGIQSSHITESVEGARQWRPAEGGGETGVMWPQARGGWQPPNLQEARNGFPPEASGG